MNLLKRFFGNSIAGNTISGTNNNTPSISHAEEDQLLKNIFVNPEPPVDDQVEKDGNAIKQFLDQDFLSKGYNDGYSSHSAETMKNQVKVIKNEFRYILSRKVDDLRQEILGFEDHLINIEGIEGRLEKQILKRLSYLQDCIQEIVKEKELSAEDEGLVMTAVYKYHEGFIRGIEAYQEEKLLAACTGLFN